jgi:hypothetical protein
MHLTNGLKNGGFLAGIALMLLAEYSPAPFAVLMLIFGGLLVAVFGFMALFARSPRSRPKSHDEPH